MSAVGELTVNIVGDMSKLSSAFSKASSEVGKFGSSVTGIGSSMTSKVGSALSTVGTAAIVTGTALGAGLVAGGAKATSMFVDFEKSVSNAASVTGLTGQAFKDAKKNISDVAQELGQKTAFSSSQAADALYNLASAGVDVSAITSDKLIPVLSLASGTQYDLADTTATVTSTLSQFGLQFESAGRVSDVFAKSAALSQASMDKLKYSMAQVGTIASSAGLSLEDTTAALSKMYDAGMDGSSAGTGLKGVIASLMAPTSQATDVFKSMGLTLSDISPASNKFSDIIEKLKEHGLDSTKAFKLFGREGAPAIMALVNQSDGLKTMTEQLKEAGGAAQTMADQQLDTLSGSLDSLSGSIENVWINVGQALAPSIRSVADGLTAAIPGIQNFVVGATESFVGFIGGLGKSISSLSTIGSTILDIFKSIFESVFGSVSSIEGSLSGVINGIMSRVAGIVVEAAPLIENAVIGIVGFFRDLVTALQPTWTSISSIATRLITLFRELFSGIAGTDTQAAANIIANVVNTISAVLARLVVEATTAFYQILPTLKSIFSTIVDTVKSIFSGLMNVINTYLPAVSTISEKLWAVFEQLPVVIESVVEKLTPVWNTLKIKFNELKPIFNDVGGELTTLYQSLKQKFGEFTKWMGDEIKKLDPVWAQLKTSFNTVKQVFIQFVKDYTPTWDEIKLKWGELKVIFNNAITALQPVWNILKGALDAGINIFNEFVTNLGPTWDNLKVAWGALIDIFDQLKIAIGDNLKSVIESVAPQFKGFLDSLSGTEIGNASGWGKTLAGVLEYLTGKIKDFLVYIKEHPEIIKFAADIVTMGIMVAAALPGIVASIVNFAINVKNWLTTAVDTVSNTYNTWNQRWEDLKTTVLNAVNSIISILAGWYYKLITTYAQVLQTYEYLRNGIQTAWENIKSVISNAANAVITTVTTWYNNLNVKFTQVKTVLQSLYNDWNTRWNNLKTAVSNIANQIIFTLQTWYTNVQNKFTQAKQAIQQLISDWSSKWNTLKSMVTTAVNNIISTLSQWYSNTQNKFSEIKNAAQNLLSDWKQKWSDMVSAVSDKATSVVNAVEGIVNKIKNKVSDFKDAGKAIINALKDGIEDKIQGVKDSINGLLTWIDDHMPHSPAKSGPLSRLPNFSEYISSPLSSAITSAKSTAKNAGTSIISSISNGIKNAASSVYNAASSTLKKVSNLFPHSPAKEGPFKTLPNWDAVFLDPLTESINKINTLSSPLSSALSNIRNPVDANISSGLNTISNVTTSNSYSYGGDTLSLGGVTLNNSLDVNALFDAWEKRMANKRRARGI